MHRIHKGNSYIAVRGTTELLKKQTYLVANVVIPLFLFDFFLYQTLIRRHVYLPFSVIFLRCLQLNLTANPKRQ